MRLKSGLTLLLTIGSASAMKAPLPRCGRRLPALEAEPVQIPEEFWDLPTDCSGLMERIFAFDRKMTYVLKDRNRTEKKYFDAQDFIGKVRNDSNGGWNKACADRCTNALDTLEKNWMGLVVFAHYKELDNEDHFNREGRNNAKVVKFDKQKNRIADAVWTAHEELNDRQACAQANVFVESGYLRKMLRRIGKDCRDRTFFNVAKSGNKRWHNCVFVKNQLIGATMGSRAKFKWKKEGSGPSGIVGQVTLVNKNHLSLVSRKRKKDGDFFPAYPYAVVSITFALEYYFDKENFRFIHSLGEEWDGDLTDTSKKFKKAKTAADLLGISFQ